MKICPECHVRIDGPDSRCPLCGTVLTPSEDRSAEEQMYPDFEQPLKQPARFPFLAKLFAFISLAVIIICGVLDLILNKRFTWSLYVIGGVAASWCTVGMHLLTDINLNYKLTIDLCVLSLYLVLIDYLSGWKGWSTDYVIPSLYIGIMITVIILALVFQEFWREYILSLVVICVLGIGPLLIFITSNSPIRFLCLAAAFMAGLLLLALLFFAGGKLFSEWRRRMNL
ncbi:MAG: hypothetical protein IKP86_10945 [Anaerolineaceae bacterium]|nr:hypothetical protein [Anaerolineaceae bacterium]